ncbi:endonuclease MutS2 [Caldibacillus thermolactis]|uniref:Endonuclease MutS2 n=1 Tax=Pallidibacillus thermolactis TaxID=251051 RepID=A0ABT2WGX1_9BACI|nr:endonuclease MutS2 [Pallidibacillus thermolactis]MCU9594672.1 endonuclease MutS2 [Pallidibacillus thermolactis]MCU9601268.1 endonuclease MutS2 [Pallidibacillus thermolactis subsp. kokeshiiformis]
MNNKAIETLEFHKIRQQLTTFASSSLGRELAEKLTPSTDFTEIVRLQEETDEAAKVLRLKGHVPLGGVFNILPHVKRAEIGSMLHPDEFVEIASTIRASRILKTFLGELVEEEDVSLPILQEYGENLNPPTELYRIITSAISENGDVLDSASEKLRSLRTQIRSLEGRVREKLENIIRSSSAQKMLSDAIITIRNDRFVIPVKQEYRSHFGGMVHDQSSSGQTLFIEPQSIVQLNNELHQTKMKEQAEIQRILTELSTKTATYSEELKQLVSILRELDFMFTKAKFGASMKATKPMMNNDGVIRLFRARHPFIPIDEVVANDIELGKDFTTIVITGPNTGGKTVTLKTVGLITLMAQAGLQIPAQDGSEVAVFESVFADIGDEQSIEQSLSTFSSHMVNIVEILRHVDSNSLVLFDELGAGTDPQEGAALAMSILDEVHRRGARVIATTHYPELKAYSYNRDGVTNASVEFDIESLSPTYRLLIGVPGRSNAFEISKRLGLSNDIIENAKTHIHVESNKVDNMIASLERSTRLAEKEEEEAKDLLKAAEKLHKDLQKAMIEFYNKKDELYEQARQEAKSIVRNAEREAEEIIRTLRQMQLEKGAEIKEHELIEARKRLEGVVPEAKQDRHPPIKKKVKQDFKPGDEVKVLSFDQKGHLIERVSENEWQVQIGIIKMKVEEDDLELIKSKPKKETQHIASIKGKEYHVGLELDLRGERYEDALVRLEKYIDDALLAGYPRVSIIHGKGTGALRTGVQNYLKNHRQVKSFHFGNANEGGTGVTIVEFK